MQRIHGTLLEIFVVVCLWSYKVAIKQFEPPLSSFSIVNEVLVSNFLLGQT